VIGLAFRHHAGRILPPEEFSGGEAPCQANYVLRELGFTVERKGGETVMSESEAGAEAGRDWSAEEVGLVVADYFDMLRLDFGGQPYSKAEHNRTLRERLEARTKGSVEFKHQNVSAVLLEMGLPYIDGYKPARNYQRAVLPQAIQSYLDAHPEVHEQLAASPVLNPTSPPPVDEGDVGRYFDDPPEGMVVPQGDEKPWLSRRGRKVDYARRDALNRHLGRLGEQFTLEVERRRLMGVGRDDLAAKVEWVAETCGDGLGFDVLSFDGGDDSEWWIEVKTTGLGKYFPFVVTANEVRCSEDLPDRFYLYRVFDFARRPRVYVLKGALSQACSLEPVQYRASLG